jgi:hypothetical protein
MTIPNYLATFRRAVREHQGRNEKDEKSPDLNSPSSLISHFACLRKEENVEKKITFNELSRQSEHTENGEKSDLGEISQSFEKSEIRVGDQSDLTIFAQAFDQLERRCPDHVEPQRWHQCLLDAQRFLAAWGDKALALGWTADELFGLHEPPAKPRPKYSRLSRYDRTGLLWFLQGRRVIALTEISAAILTPSGATLTYRKTQRKLR